VSKYPQEERKTLKTSHSLLRTKANFVNITDLKSTFIQTEINKILDFVLSAGNKTAGYKTDKPHVVGLSANQVGINKSICVVDMGIGHKTYSDLHVLINPRIIKYSKDTIEYPEGCVSIPNVRGFVKRYKRVTIKALDRFGNKIIFELEYWPAVLLQHEIDHLNGKLFIDKLDDPTRAHHVEENDYLLHKRLGKKWNKFTDVSSLVRE
jgi:peptide deformylase